MVEIKYKKARVPSATKTTVKRLDYSRRSLWVKAGLLGRILSEERFFLLARAEIKTFIETSEIDIALSALKVSDSDAGAVGLNDHEIAIARYWARLIRTKNRRGILVYKSGSQRLTLIFNNPGTRR